MVGNGVVLILFLGSSGLVEDEDFVCSGYVLMVMKGKG
jgi:hypothetical protein